ncbi:PAS domain-containing protein [Lusitaniella coriacea LEGE 07157]|uniref:Circadian input-output histidine kinase CikA n=1 Tax=Lusitaniella coriacea LEGE 07157 TaxID=945747 RepID=A0A8J7DZT9_9CYAN|nr:chemotaxis protein CheB [Lusitaniella coriacea]MBE9116786.1 PAS domain-containing protein [Lusitaniella coriacea LEGE 07157]
MTTSSTPDRDRFFIVGIGASAGGVQALESFFAGLPDNPNGAFVVVQHLSPNHRSMMTEILQRQTTLPVEEVRDRTLLEPAKVYVLPPRKALTLEDRRLHLEETSDSPRYPINRFFQSLVAGWGERTIAILLSGTGNDGTEGLQAVSRAGGVALVQSPETAQFTSMPTSAIPSGLVDEILSPQDLAQTVYELIRFSDNFPTAKVGDANLIDPDRLQHILNILAEREDIDFSHYKVSTLSRRIHHRCALTRNDSIQVYIQFLEESPEEQKLLRQDLLIGATCFFRDREVWDFLQTKVLLPHLEKLQPQQQLRIWVSACATGEEAYSMAILVDEAVRQVNKPIQVKIFATDLDTNALEIAAQGVYPESIANDVSPERLERYFDYKGDRYQVKRSLREMLIIAPHDLTKNAGFSKMNLVSCRNVLIYMQPQLQHQVLRLLHFALAPQGTLFLGSSETLGSLAEEFISTNQKWKVFQKRRDTQLSLMPITRQAIITPLKSHVRTKTRQQQLDRLLAEVFRLCLSERQVTCFVVNSDNQLLRIFHNAAQLLEYPMGEANLEATDIVHPALKLPLSTALHRAKRDKQTVLYTGIKLQRDDEESSITMRVGLDGSHPADDRLIIVFEIETQPTPSTAALRFDVDREAAQQITELEYELQQTRENLQVTIEELETVNEEQQATNEELLASNEELQSTNEELQSVNEELYTVNSEYQSKIQELTELNNDIDNLLRSTDIGVVFLDAQLNIRKFTPAATRVINVKEADIGRPLTDLTNSLDCPKLFDILQQVNQTKEPYEQEIKIAQSHDCVLMRVHPYLQNGAGSDGIVLTFVSISDLKQVQDQLQQANEILEKLYETSPVGLCLQDEDLKFLRINQALADINGASVEEHLGKRLRDITPELASRIEPILRQVIDTGKPIHNVEIRSVTPTNPERERCWTVSYYPIDFLLDGYGVGGVVVEVTERVRAEKALRESRAKLVEAQRLAKIGNWELELQEDIDLTTARAEWSDELFQIYRLEPQQEPLSFTELLQCHPPDSREILQNALNSLIENGIPFSVDIQFACPNEEPCYLNAIGQAIRNKEGEIIKLYGTVMDITKRKQIETELLCQNAALEEAIAVAQAADSENQAKSEFLANMSHEIRTPMNAILVASQLLEKTEVNLKQQKLLQTLTNGGQRLLALINDILDLSKLEAQRLRLENRPFNVKMVFLSLSELFRSQAQTKEIDLKFDIAADVPQKIVGDDFRLQQVLSNLISNAIKFTQSGEIAIAVRHEGEPAANESSALLHFSVRDTGIGIDLNRQKLLFQPFIQADSSTTRQFGGTGLGLTICRRIVQLMGGEIGVSSTPGEGSTVWFKVAFDVAEPSNISPVAQETDALPITALSDTGIDAPKVLIVEDYPDNRDLLLMILEPLNYQADWVSNGQEFLDRIARQDYDIVLMDCQMPVLDGYEATRRLRDREGEEKHTIVIGLTAHALEGDRRKCLEAGMDDYLSKPIMADDFVELLKKWTS